MVLKQIKYMLLLIVVACGSSSKEVDFQELSINAVKNELLDPNSFELIKYSLDTTMVHAESLFLLGVDSSLVDTYNSLLDLYKNDVDKQDYEEYTLKMNDVNRRMDSCKSLLNEPDRVSGYRTFVRYYANSKGGLRVINEMKVTLNPEGIVLKTYSLD